VVRFDGLDAGTYGLQEEIPAGYGRPLVLCTFADPDAGISSDDIFRVEVTGDAVVTVELGDGQRLWCEWYNVPLLPEEFYFGNGRGDIGHNMRVCPAGFDAYAADVAELNATCLEPVDGFTLSLVRDGEVLQTRESSGQPPVWIDFEDLEPGRYSVDVTMPAGFGPPILFCYSDNADHPSFRYR
jgi:hypothetical protein